MNDSFNAKNSFLCSVASRRRFINLGGNLPIGHMLVMSEIKCMKEIEPRRNVSERSPIRLEIDVRKGAVL